MIRQYYDDSKEVGAEIQWHYLSEELQQKAKINAETIVKIKETEKMLEWFKTLPFDLQQKIYKEYDE